MLVIGVAQHAVFILVHEAAHYRLFAARWANDGLGRFMGMAAGLSMCTYRVTHRLHHNHLYTEEDPDTAIHGGYPRGRAYLLRKLGEPVQPGTPLYRVYAAYPADLEFARLASARSSGYSLGDAGQVPHVFVEF